MKSLMMVRKSMWMAQDTPEIVTYAGNSNKTMKKLGFFCDKKRVILTKAERTWWFFRQISRKMCDRIRLRNEKCLF